MISQTPLGWVENLAVIGRFRKNLGKITNTTSCRTLVYMIVHCHQHFICCQWLSFTGCVCPVLCYFYNFSFFHFFCRQYLELDLSISDSKVHEIADLVTKHFVCFITEIRRLFLVEDMVDSLKVFTSSDNRWIIIERLMFRSLFLFYFYNLWLSILIFFLIYEMWEVGFEVSRMVFC